MFYSSIEQKQVFGFVVPWNEK